MTYKELIESYIIGNNVKIGDTIVYNVLSVYTHSDSHCFELVSDSKRVFIFWDTDFEIVESE
jgi:hypothetical protein